MNLFGRRPLCIFAFLFFMTALLFYEKDIESKLKCAQVVILASVLLLLLAFLLKKIRAQLIVVLICLSGILFSLANSYYQIDYMRQTAEQFVGKQSVAMIVMKQEASADASSEYLVDITQIGEMAVSYRCLLFCSFVTDLHTGDRLYANVELLTANSSDKELPGYRKSSEDGVYLTAVLQNEEGAMVERIDPNASFFSMLFQPSGIRLATQKVFDRFSSYIDRVFDSDKLSALVKSIFIGETSSVDDLTMRDFRRCGLSHLMSVSGLHFSVLLGMISWLLQLVRIPKAARCVISAIFAIVFLVLTNFALSACRSAIMVLAVYWNFLFMEDHDSPTALFAAMLLIVWISPHSVADLGLWMSFLATLGLVTVFPMIEEIMPYWTHKNKYLKFLLRTARNAILGVAITLIATVFLIPIYWAFFGEISVVAVLANLLASPLAFWVLPIIVFAILFANIPFLGGALVWICSLLFEMLLGIVRWLSGLKLATLPLNDTFSNAIIPVFTILMLITLLVPIRKHKLLLGVPAVFVMVSLTAFQIWLHIFGTPTLTYAQFQRSDSVIVQEKGKTVVCSVSDGDQMESYLLLLALRDQSAVRIDILVLSHYHQKHDEMLTYLNNRILIETVALPYPRSKSDLTEAEKLVCLANDYGIELIFFDRGERLPITESVQMSLDASGSNPMVGINFCGKESQAMYLSASNVVGAFDVTKEHDVVFFGVYGGLLEHDYKVDLRGKHGSGLWLFPSEMGGWKQNLLVHSQDVFCFREEEDRKSITVDFP